MRAWLACVVLPALVGAGPIAGRAADLTGRWDVTDVVEATDHPPFLGLRVVYRLRLRQEGVWVLGDGEKSSVNGIPLPPAQRTPVSVAGTVDGARVTLRYVETGVRRESEGRFEWTLAPDGTRMRGSFTSTAASSSGTSVAVRRQ